MISVIVPIYNAEKYILRCIECIAKQDYQDWELLLIDDGSKDHSGVLCEEAANKDSRIKVIHQENQGASIARRVGIENSKGEYLVFMDCDDLIEHNFISSLYQAITEQGTEIAACKVAKHPENETISIEKVLPSKILKEKELFQRFFKYEFWGYVDKIYQREVFTDIYFPKYTINEDYVVMLQLFTRYKEIAYIDTPLYHYLIHENSLSHQAISNRAFDEYYNKLWAYEFCKSNNKEYIKQADAQLVESCIKLCRGVQDCGSTTLRQMKPYKEMMDFMKRNIVNILRNPHLLLGLKYMALRVTFPIRRSF